MHYLKIQRIFLIFSIAWIIGLFITSMISIILSEEIYFLILILIFPISLIILILIIDIIDKR